MLFYLVSSWGFNVSKHKHCRQSAIPWFWRHVNLRRHDHLKILFHIVSQQQGARHRRLVYSHVTIGLAFAVGGCSLRFGPVDAIREAHCAAHQFRRSRHSAPLLSSPNGLSQSATIVFHFLLWFQIVFTLLSRAFTAVILRLWWHFRAPWWRRHGTGGGAVLLSFIGGLSKGAA